MKTLLITGGAGYLGYRILDKIKNKYRVIILDNFLYSEPDDLKKISKKIKYYIGNAEDKYLLNKIFSHKIDSVIHLSGLSNDPSSALNPELTRKANDESTINLLNISKRKKVKRFIFASSCSVYGFTGSKKFVTEKAKLNPLSEYAISKVKCEKMIKNFQVKAWLQSHWEKELCLDRLLEWDLI